MRASAVRRRLALSFAPPVPVIARHAASRTRRATPVTRTLPGQTELRGRQALSERVGAETKPHANHVIPRDCCSTLFTATNRWA